MARIQVEVKVHLPHDANGVSAQPGQIIEVDTDAPMIRSYLEAGYLYAADPLVFPGSLQPPASSPGDAAADAAANEADGEGQDAASADPGDNAADGPGGADAPETPATAPPKRAKAKG